MTNPPAKDGPPPLKVSSRELASGSVVFYLAPADELDKSKPLHICMWEKTFFDQHPWVYPMVMQICIRMANEVMARAGYTVQELNALNVMAQAIGATEPPSLINVSAKPALPKNLIELDPIEEAKAGRKQ